MQNFHDDVVSENIYSNAQYTLLIGGFNFQVEKRSNEGIAGTWRLWWKSKPKIDLESSDGTIMNKLDFILTDNKDV